MTVAAWCRCREVRRRAGPAGGRMPADGSVVSPTLCSMRSRTGHVALLILFAYTCMRTAREQLVSTAAGTFGRLVVGGQSRWNRADTLSRWSRHCVRDQSPGYPRSIGDRGLSRPQADRGYGTTKWESARRSRAQMALLAHGAPGEEGFTIRLGCGWPSPLRGLGRPISRGS